MGNRPLPVYEAELITAGDLSKGFSASGNYWFMASGTKREKRKTKSTKTPDN
jgi:hypothetical protein